MTDEQDYHDPDFVIGAVLAQLEELEPLEKLNVLVDVLATVTAEIAKRKEQPHGNQ